MFARPIPALLIIAGLALLIVLYLSWSVRKPQSVEVRVPPVKPTAVMTERFGEEVRLEKSLSPGEVVVDSR